MSEAALLNLFAWSVQVALLTLVAGGVSRLLHIDAPGVRYAWWRIVLGACLALPLVQPWQPAALVPVERLALETAVVPAVETGTGSRAPAIGSVLPPPPATPRWPLLVTSVLVTGIILRLAWLAAGLARLRRLRRAGVRADRSEVYDEVRSLLEVDAEIRYVASLGQPVTFGCARAVVLLPESLRTLSPAVQRAVLAHELWHVRRRDWRWSLGEEILRAVLWFHPAIWYLVSRVRAAREEVVDELSIRLTNARRSYLEALLTFADQPTLYPAAPFARRRHLFTRMLLISKEAVMSSKRILASSAAMAGAILFAGWYGALAFPLTTAASAPPPADAPADARAGQAQPRDPRPGVPGPATSRELELRSAINADPQNVAHWLELAKLQGQRGASGDAEATYAAGLRAVQDTKAARQLALAGARFHAGAGQFDKSVALLEDAAALDPADPAGHQLVATFYFEKAQKDPSLTPAEKQSYLQSGIAATDRALAHKPDYVEALTYKNILLRMQANMETDAGRRQELIAQADALRTRAIELAPQRTSIPAVRDPSAPPPPPPPSPPPPPQYYEVDGQQAVRVGGDVPAPVKLRNVNPVYPSEALEAAVQGTVVIELVIDTQGSVRNARVLKSIPMLDEAALGAVRQWRFAPAHLNGAPVPLAMTVTVNFTRQ